MKNLIITIAALMISAAASAGTVKGDINSDDKVDIHDVAVLVNVLNGKATSTDACDINKDNTVDLNDLSYLVDLVLKNERIEDNPQIPAGDTSSGDIPKEAESKSGNIGFSTDK